MGGKIARMAPPDDRSHTRGPQHGRGPKNRELAESENAELRTEALRGLLTSSLHAWERTPAAEDAHVRKFLRSDELPPNLDEPLSTGSEYGLAHPPTDPRPDFRSAAEPRPIVSAHRGLSPSLLSLVPSMVQELWERSPQLLTINPSRRESILQHLQTLASGNVLPKATLREWLENQRNQTEARAFSAYFEEIAILTLCQALLLKRWREMTGGTVQREQIGRLNFELSSSLKPYVPLHRESWHLTRPNIYTWYQPSPSMVEEIDHVLSGFPIEHEGPGLILEVCNESRRYQPTTPEIVGYDQRFSLAILQQLVGLGVELDPLPFNRKRLFYTPNLRFGGMGFGTPKQTQWIGFESNLFQLLCAEMMLLWWGPKDPPDWALGSSLEAHPREQLSLGSAAAPRAGVLQFLSEIEACDFSWVLEEQTKIASKQRGLLENLPYFKKLVTTGTSVGCLQAAVAITKLRPYGKMLWARETPLTLEEGADAIGFLFSRGRLLAEWDLSAVEHHLPTKTPLFPRYWYLFEREIDTERRSTHRPRRVSVTGAIKSHIEVSTFLEEVLRAGIGEPQAQVGGGRSQWRMHVAVSPTAQKDWLSHWPTKTKAQTIQVLDRLQERSVPLATIGTLRTLHAQAPRPEWKGLRIEASDSPRALVVTPLEHLRGVDAITGFVLFLTDDSAAATIAQYLESAWVQLWLDHRAERRGEKWALSEALLKMLPVPEALHRVISGGEPFEMQWHVNALGKDPKLPLPEALRGWSRFSCISKALLEIDTSLCRLSTYVQADGTVVWKNVLKLIPVNEICPMPHSSQLVLQGNLPVHSAIVRIERTKGNPGGIVLMTESGAVMKIGSPLKTLLDMVHSQATHFSHPTWGELVDWVRIPRNLNYAETLRQDLEQNRYDLGRKRVTLRERIEQTLKEIESSEPPTDPSGASSRTE